VIAQLGVGLVRARGSIAAPVESESGDASALGSIKDNVGKLVRIP
jgi:hypothetical protein